MAHVPQDTNSLVKLLKTYHSRIVGLQDETLTSIQRQQSEGRLKHSFANDGVSYSFGHYDDPGKMSFVLESFYIRDSGVITDVSPVGPYPIRLSVGKNVTVYFEPRDLTWIDHWRCSDLNNARFAGLSKGSSFKFVGRLHSCDCYFDRPVGGAFTLMIHSDLHPPMSVTDWLRKLWNGKRPGIDFIR